MDLGNNFKYYRNRMGYTQTTAAEKIGLKYYQLGNYETNRSEPSIDILKKMAEVYETTVDQLIGYESPNKTDNKRIEEIIIASKEQLTEGLQTLSKILDLRMLEK